MYGLLCAVFYSAVHGDEMSIGVGVSRVRGDVLGDLDLYFQILAYVYLMLPK